EFRRVLFRSVVPAEDAGTRRDQMADDDVLLQADQLVAGTAHCGVREHARRLLEGGCTDERLRRERGLRDTEQQRLRARRGLPLRDELLVGLPEHRAVDVLALEELAVAGV